MVVIRAEQIEAMALASRQRLISELLGFLRRNCGSLCEKMDDAELRRFIEQGLRRGEGYGYEVDGDLSRFVALEMVLGRGFHGPDGPSWVIEILILDDLPPSARMALLWAEAGQRQSAADRASK